MDFLKSARETIGEQTSEMKKNTYDWFDHSKQLGILRMITGVLIILYSSLIHKSYISSFITYFPVKFILLALIFSIGCYDSCIGLLLAMAFMMTLIMYYNQTGEYFSSENDYAVSNYVDAQNLPSSLLPPDEYPSNKPSPDFLPVDSILNDPNEQTTSDVKEFVANDDYLSGFTATDHES